LSTDWHRFLGFQAEREHEKGCRKQKRAPFKSEANEARVNQWSWLRKIDTAAQLQQIIGKEAKFRGV
jgi:hypothetical protein